MNEPMHRTFLVVDVENSSQLGNTELAAMRSTLYRILDEATDRTGTVVADDDRGDGCLLVLSLPVLEVLDQIVESVVVGVRTHNHTVGPLDWMRVRVAVHEGYVHKDGRGWSSDALTATFRLNDAAVVKGTLKNAARAVGVVVISDIVYQGVVRHNYRPTVTSAEYRSVDITTKEGPVRAWLRVPGYPEPPLPADTSAPAVAQEANPVRAVGESGSITANNMIVGDVRARTIIGGDNVGGTVPA
ncbi:hypothetical protein BOX37_08215 [Nocardia mangyaensis]|uniref:Guanylate cyclase domain-containing protein n=1 Tax=Nocardia mangyaensis TaxID=2213200 RepID=A0A1J0VPJ2_9NOCA|nr:hypothetical protein [Nocardia mangyaensis]APE33957.1 hypothetical protein BOX37_08215 [Nocardia mangyaensis]